MPFWLPIYGDNHASIFDDTCMDAKQIFSIEFPSSICNWSD